MRIIKWIYCFVTIFGSDCSRRLAQIKAICQLPEVNSIAMRKALTFARDRFIIHPGASDGTMIVDNKASVLRLFNTCMKR